MFFHTIFSIFFDEKDSEDIIFLPENLITHYLSEIPDICVDGIYIAGSYKDYHKKIESYKYRSHREYAEYFSEIYHAMIQKYVGNSGEYIIVPVPMHWTRYVYRSYDHMSLIALFLEKKYGYKISHLLGVHFTLRQAKLHKAARKKNRIDRFFLKNTDFSGKKIILIDDIISSGYTLSSCSKLLKNVSHSEVLSFFIASNSY